MLRGFTGTVWALDQSADSPQLVHLRYAGTEVNNHKASNILKSNLGPFVYKPKVTVEVEGDKAAVRLRSTSPVMFIRCSVQDDAAPGSKAESTRTDWALLVLTAKDDRRIASTMAFTQFTGSAKRSEGQVEIAIEKFGATSWYKITPKKPLEPGEYGLVQLPRVQNQFPTRIFDFAIDPKAPNNPEAVKPKQGPPQADKKQ